ncbi:MAG: zinc-binding alcohol dehydrogenase [Syntrophales bacterium]|nr:zinc-binding alcohol dehydrogenase [Syntrophales bacterium]
MKRRSLYFTAPGKVEIREEELTGPGRLLVRALHSAVSAGTEMLVLTGLAPSGMRRDETIPSLADGTFSFPFKYGYAMVGEVLRAPAEMGEWEGKKVFSFHPHEDLFFAEPEQLLILPAGTAPASMALLPAMETAVHLLRDGRPMAGEKAAVFGQGVIGLLVTDLLSGMLVSELVTFDPHPQRRKKSREMGATESEDPFSPGALERFRSDFDLIFELSGDPAALDSAIRTAAYGSRIIVGSWYGNRSAEVNLGGFFHRGNIRITSSQVSRIPPEQSARWTRRRRLETAQKLLTRGGPPGIITHRFPFEKAAEAYLLCGERQNEVLQVILDY